MVSRHGSCISKHHFRSFVQVAIEAVHDGLRQFWIAFNVHPETRPHDEVKRQSQKKLVYIHLQGLVVGLRVPVLDGRACAPDDALELGLHDQHGSRTRFLRLHILQN